MVAMPPEGLPHSLNAVVDEVRFQSSWRDKSGIGRAPTARAITRVANTPGAEHLDDAIVEKLAALPRRLRRAKLAELRKAHEKDVKAAQRDAKGMPLRRKTVLKKRKRRP